MKYSSIAAASALSGLATSSALLSRDPRAAPVDVAVIGTELLKRATAQAPNGYAPTNVDCPSTRPSVRNAGTLSEQESAWLKKRRSKTVDPMRKLLSRVNIPGFDARAYIDSHSSNTTALPNIAISFSGGGYRAMLNGAGALAAFDDRTAGATGNGQLGGLLQSATYISALSGGGWLVGSIFANNFTSVQNILAHEDVWQFQNSIFKGPPTGGVQILESAQYYHNLVDTVHDKSDAGFNTSITDFYGRALSFQLINATDGGPSYTFSSIQEDTSFSNGDAPMPILVADGRNPGEKIVSLNATVYEINPWELGSSDPTTFAFTPLKYLGSEYEAGVLPDSKRCVRGFDNLGFMMGTSASLFNQIVLYLDRFDVSDILKEALTRVLKSLGDDSNDIADYSPNPFYHFNKGTNLNADLKRLTLVDGGEDGQNIPLNPVIQPHRNVDVVFASDSSADTVDEAAPNWPNGTAIVATYERANTDIMNRTSFPYVPGQDTFIALGLNSRPTFFGCNSSNVTEGDNIPPLIVYLPNAPYAYLSNVSTFGKLDFSIKERNAIITNGYNVATQGNGTRSGADTWTTCVGCAILSRSFERNGVSVPDACKKCFTDYCWNGTTVAGTTVYKPAMILGSDAQINTEEEENGGASLIPGTVFGVVAALVSGFLLM